MTAEISQWQFDRRSQTAATGAPKPDGLPSPGFRPTRSLIQQLPRIPRSVIQFQPHVVVDHAVVDGARRHCDRERVLARLQQRCIELKLAFVPEALYLMARERAFRRSQLDL